MCGRLAATVVAVLCSLTLTVPAEAQFTTDCLRPIAIPDTWIENQGSTTTFDATGTNPDVYDPKGGYQPSTDDGRLLVITLQYPASTPNSNGSIPVRLGYGGAVDFRDFIAGCVGVPYDVGDLIPVETGILSGPTAMGIDDLVAQDPSATWDSSTKTVVGSAFARSPRIIQLPVFDPAEYITALQSGLHQIRVVKIVGFFVESRSPGATVHGYLTARGRLTATSSIASAGQTASLSARIEMPAGPVGGVPIQFEFLGQPAGVATTNDADTQVIIDLPTAGIASGTYPGAVVAKLGDPAGFLLADASTADFALTSGIQDPQVTWRAPNPLTYGTPLGPSQLKATAAVPGQFFYTPPAGTVVHAGMHNLTVTFVPDDNQQYAQATATVVVNVTPALLTVRVLPASKLYLDPLPPFLFSVDGFVNGDTLRLLSGAAAFQTAASASSPIGTYEVRASGFSSPDYTIGYQPGILTILWRPASLIYPANGAWGVDATTQPFTWTDADGEAYYLYVGSSRGANDIVNSGEIQTTSYRAPPGVLGNAYLYARLWTKHGGTWSYVDSTFYTSSLARLLSPINGGTVTNPFEPFTWNSIASVQAYYLYVGTAPGAKDLVNSGETQQTTYVPRVVLPANQTLYARLWTKLRDVWQFSDTTFKVVPLVAVLTFPANGATNADMRQPVQWTAVTGAQAYTLWFGSTPGGADLVNSGELQLTSYASRVLLPANQTLYARLWTKTGGIWRFTDSTFSAMPMVARFTCPASAGAVLDPSQPLAWTSVQNAQAYYLYIGSTPGAKDLVNTGEIQQTSYLPHTALPANQTLYARLWTRVNGIWLYVDTAFTVSR